MADKTGHDMRVSSDDTRLNEKRRGTRQAHGTSNTAREGLLVDLTDTDQQTNMHAVPQDPSDLSSREAEVSPKKTGLFSNVIGLWPMTRASQQPSEKMKADEVQMVIDSLRQDKQTLQERIEIAENKISGLTADLSSAGHEYQKLQTAAHDKVAQLRIQNNSFGENNARLEHAWQNARRELSRWEARYDNASRQSAAEKEADQQKFAQLNSEIMKLQAKNDTLRQMLVPVSEKQVLDGEVVQKFASLRSGIIGLVRQTWVPRLKHGVDVVRLSPTQQDLIALAFPITYDRLRCLFFTFVHDNVFESPSYFLGDDFKTLEQLLQRAERILTEHSPEVNDQLITEWRNATFKVTEIYRDDGRHLSSALQHQIWSFLDPVQTKGSAAEENGRKRLETACDMAVELGFMIRQMKDNFLVDNLSHAIDEPLSLWEELAEEVEEVEVDKYHRPGTIAYVIMGALVKNPQETLDKVLVLEKAEVGVYR